MANFTNVIVKMFSVRDFYTKDQLVCCKYLEIPSLNFTVPFPDSNLVLAFNSKVLNTWPSLEQLFVLNSVDYKNRHLCYKWSSELQILMQIVQ